MKTGILLQARLDSSRLPRKALLPFGGPTLLESCMRRLSRLGVDCRVLACDEASAATFAPLAARSGFELFAGPKEDVLGRFALAIKAYGLDRVIRATGDNPFVSPELALRLMDRARDYDYAGFLGMPLGLGVEVVKARALLEAAAEAIDPYEREHVCPFLYRRPERYALLREDASEPFFYPAGRVTVDSAGDYENVLELARLVGFDPATEILVAALKARDAIDWSLVQPWTAD